MTQVWHSMAQHPVHDGSAPAAYTSQWIRHRYVFIGTMTMDSFAALDAIDHRIRTFATMLYLARDDALISRRLWSWNNCSVNGVQQGTVASSVRFYVRSIVPPHSTHSTEAPLSPLHRGSTQCPRSFSGKQGINESSRQLSKSWTMCQYLSMRRLKYIEYFSLLEPTIAWN